MAASDVVVGLTDNRAALRSALERVSTSNGTPYYDGLMQVVEKVFGRSERAVSRTASVGRADRRSGLDQRFRF
jgi:hypothetical protein